MIIYTLYVKTHLKTGLKYLGYTKNNPYTYKGSGKHWRNHLKKHGNNVWTNIIFQSENKEDISSMGIFYSNHWTVVKSKDWANEIQENGIIGGITLTTEQYKKSARKRWEDPSYRNKQLEIRRNKDFLKSLSESIKSAQEKNNAREKISLAARERVLNGTHHLLKKNRKPQV